MPGVTQASDQLFRSARPCFSKPITEENMCDWIESIKSLGINSVMCLLGGDQLDIYAPVGGLLEFYKRNGLIVGHLPTKDYKIPPMTEKETADALEILSTLPKPILVHCNAGINRTWHLIEAFQNRG